MSDNKDSNHDYEIAQISRNFANLASHQLRTPLASIKTQAHLLAGGYIGELDEKQLGAVKSILAATDHMNNLLSMLLNISQLEGDKYERQLKEVDIKEILSNIHSELNDRAKEKDLTFKLATPKDCPSFTSDSDMLHEIFTNIIINAIKYTPKKGKIYVSIDCKPKDCTVKIEDTGIGIPKKFQEKIYNQYFRAENAIDSKQSGNGLGLYLVKQLIELLGGKIKLKSAPNKGSTFWVRLPTA